MNCGSSGAHGMNLGSPGAHPMVLRALNRRKVLRIKIVKIQRKNVFSHNHYQNEVFYARDGAKLAKNTPNEIVNMP